MKWLRSWRGYVVMAVIVALTGVAGLVQQALGYCPSPNCDSEITPCETGQGCYYDCDAIKCGACATGPCPDSIVSCPECDFVHWYTDGEDNTCASGYRCDCLIECHYYE